MLFCCKRADVSVIVAGVGAAITIAFVTVAVDLVAVVVPALLLLL